jgi:hypothetical protein
VRSIGLASIWLCVSLPLLARAADDSSLTLSDLDRYADVLRAKPSELPRQVTFRDLWQRPDLYAGRPVRVEGRLARRFRQPAIGAFPALTELWILDREGNPLCLVCPATADAAELALGATVQFTGTYLKRVRYRGVDTDRSAPLVVGSAGPTVRAAARDRPSSAVAASFDWVIGLAVGCFVLAVMVALHVRRPRSRPRPLEPDPQFMAPDEPRSDSEQLLATDESRIEHG